MTTVHNSVVTFTESTFEVNVKKINKKQFFQIRNLQLTLRRFLGDCAHNLF